MAQTTTRPTLLPRCLCIFLHTSTSARGTSPWPRGINPRLSPASRRTCWYRGLHKHCHAALTILKYTPSATHAFTFPTTVIRSFTANPKRDCGESKPKSLGPNGFSRTLTPGHGMYKQIVCLKRVSAIHSWDLTRALICSTYECTSCCGCWPTGRTSTQQQ